MTGAHAIGLDIGGSSIKAGVIDGDAKCLGKAAKSLAGIESVAGLIDGLVELRAELEHSCGPTNAIGVGVPGLIDGDTGRIEESPNLPWLNGVDLRARASDALGPCVEPTLENDANAAALGESFAGGGRDAQHFLFVTLGTGVGGGLILGNELWRGAGLAGEIGHVKVRERGPVCGCGRVGCLETFASATAAERRALERGLPADAPGDLERLAAAARAGAGGERELLAEVGVDLGRGIAAAVNLLDLRTFVFGGGFSAALDVLIPGIRRGLREGSYGRRVENESIDLRPAELGPDAGWIGAARSALAAKDR